MLQMYNRFLHVCVINVRVLMNIKLKKCGRIYINATANTLQQYYYESFI